MGLPAISRRKCGPTPPENRKPPPVVHCLFGILPARILRVGIWFILAYGITLILRDKNMPQASAELMALGERRWPIEIDGITVQS
jgi:hypothetical protein